MVAWITEIGPNLERPRWGSDFDVVFDDPQQAREPVVA